MNADHMPDPATPRINAADRAQRHAAHGPGQGRRRPRLGRVVGSSPPKDPVLAEPTAERFEIYGEHADGDTPSADGTRASCAKRGFGEARTVWASPSDALVLALK